jgi:protein-arginine kinase activator protein McsA
MAEEFKEHGYDKEAEFFFKKNKELLDQMRQKLDTQRADQKTQAQKHQHWMKCPKCGSDLKEVELLGIKVDQCTQCFGMYFDKGELELLLETTEPRGFLGGLKRLFIK